MLHVQVLDARTSPGSMTGQIIPPLAPLLQGLAYQLSGRFLAPSKLSPPITRCPWVLPPHPAYRNMQGMLELQRKLRRLLQPHLPRKVAQIRTRCADRIVHFLRLVQAGAADSAVVRVGG